MKEGVPLLALYRHVHPRRNRPPEYWAVRQARDIAQKKRRAAQRAALGRNWRAAVPLSLR
jgi:hypothetical protein